MKTDMNLLEDGMNALKGKNVTFNDRYLNVDLEDGRIISTPIECYPELLKATISQLSQYKFICQGTGIEWNSIDYHLSIESMLYGISTGKKVAA